MNFTQDDIERRFSPIYNAMDIFFAWERLRLLYNLILIGEIVVFAVLTKNFVHLLFWLTVCGSVFVANVCFCAGQVVEHYLCWLGCQRIASRWVVFVIGTVISAVAAWSAIQTWREPLYHGGGGFNS